MPPPLPRDAPRPPPRLLDHQRAVHHGLGHVPDPEGGEEPKSRPSPVCVKVGTGIPCLTASDGSALVEIFQRSEDKATTITTTTATTTTAIQALKSSSRTPVVGRSSSSAGCGGARSEVVADTALVSSSGPASSTIKGVLTSSALLVFCGAWLYVLVSPDAVFGALPC